MSHNVQTEVKLLRKDSKGIEGSYDNADHHAKAILPFIDAMKDKMTALGFTLWKTGNNVHEFHTADGNRYTLRAFRRDGEYVGVRLALRISRSAEYRLIDIDTVDEVPRLLDAMSLMARPNTGNETGVMVSAAKH